MRVRLSAAALADLAAIKSASQDYDAARTPIVMGRIADVIRTLSQWPRLGRERHVPGAREFPVPRLPFVIVYQHNIGEPDELIVLRVFHARRDRS